MTSRLQLVILLALTLAIYVRTAAWPALLHLPLDRASLVAESGGKTTDVSHRLVPGQLALTASTELSPAVPVWWQEQVQT